jgi:nucleoside-diphosphate kinase
MSIERTFIAIKPDGVMRGLVAEIIGRFEKRGLKLVAMKFVQVTKEFAGEHYADLKAKPFFGALCDYFASGPVVAMVWEGLNATKVGRMLLGETNPQASLPGTIRGDFCQDVGRNVCHGSDGPESAAKEIAHWFKPEELVNWKSPLGVWCLEKGW